MLDGRSVLLPLGQCHPLKRLIPLENAVPLLRVHIVELNESVPIALLRLRGQIFESWFILKLPQLFLHGDILVSLHPLLQMLLLCCSNRWTGSSAG